MGFLDRILPDDRKAAATKYEGRESATDRAARKRLQRHHRTGAGQAAARGQAWEDADRKREKRRR